MRQKFLKGQRVVVKGNSLPIRMKEDQMGTVLEDEDLDVSIGFDNNVKGHDCNGLCKYGHGWWITRHRVILIKEEEDDLYV